MRFEEAFKAMRNGKKLTTPRLKPNYLYLDQCENGQFYVNDGIYDIPIQNIKTEYLLAEDWEIVDE